MGKHKNRRIGPRMKEAVDYVSRYPGCVKIEAARAVAPSGENGIGLGFGYKTIDRAIAAGLIMQTRHEGHWSLELGVKGIDLVRSWG